VACAAQLATSSTSTRKRVCCGDAGQCGAGIAEMRMTPVQPLDSDGQAELSAQQEHDCLSLPPRLSLYTGAALELAAKTIEKPCGLPTCYCGGSALAVAG
jgi:hypothetical protein